MPVTAKQLVALNLRRARELRGLTQEEAARRLEPYLGKLWSKATFSAAERSAAPGARVREFTADEVLAFASTFGVSVAWFYLPPEGEEELPEVSCGGPVTLQPRELIDSALPHADRELGEGPRLRALMRRPELRRELDERILAGVRARIHALASNAGVPDTTTHAANLRRLASALESAEDAAQCLVETEWQNLEEGDK
jgi:transcriptional regulator with XRE-family HTH domain